MCSSSSPLPPGWRWTAWSPPWPASTPPPGPAPDSASTTGSRGAGHSCSAGYIMLCHVYCVLSCAIVHVFREGYTGADGFLTHVNEVKEHLDSIISKVGVDRVKVCMTTLYILHPPASLPRSCAWALQRNWIGSDLHCLAECQVLSHSAQ